jgi:hypothetical protein
MFVYKKITMAPATQVVNPSYLQNKIFLAVAHSAAQVSNLNNSANSEQDSKEM